MATHSLERSTLEPLAPEASGLKIDLSKPDNSELIRGRGRLVEAIWFFLGAPFIASKLMPFFGIRVWLLRCFGARIGKAAHIKPGFRVKFPWYLTIGDHCWIGEDAWIDNLTQVTIESHVCISQGAYLCTGNHDWSDRNMRLFTGRILLKTGSWVGAKSVVCPGVTIHEYAILTVGSVACKDVPAGDIHTGNPATFTRHRRIKN